MTAEVKDSNLLKDKGDVDILDIVGSNGLWQKIVFVITLITLIPTSLQNLIITFIAPNVDHWCSRPTGVNISVEEWKLHGLPPDDKKCSRYKHFNVSDMLDRNDSTTVSCNSWEYDHSLYISTIVGEWNLVCNQEWLVSLSKTIFVAGQLLSTTFVGYVSDRYGRKPVVVICNIVTLFASVISAFSSSFLMFSVLRVIIAVACNGVFEAAFCLLMEVASPAFRPAYGLSVELGWCMGFLSLPLIAWILRDWFWIQLCITIPSLVLLSSYWLITESPRWLVSQGNTEEVEKVLNKAIKMNGVEETNLKGKVQEIMFYKSKEKKENQKVSFLDLLKIPGMWKRTLNLYYLWGVLGFVYYGLTYNTNELAGDPFINFAVSGVIEIPGYTIPILIIKLYGRRKPLSVFLISGGLACLLMYPLPSDIPWLSVTVSMLGKFWITCAFGSIYIYTSELFPTVVRNVGISSASLCSRLGSLLAPFVRELGKATYPVVPQMVFGVLAVIGGISVLFLPETNNFTLPDTIEEAANFSNKRLDKRKANNVSLNESSREEKQENNMKT